MVLSNVRYSLLGAWGMDLLSSTLSVGVLESKIWHDRWSNDFENLWANNISGQTNTSLETGSRTQFCNKTLLSSKQEMKIGPSEISASADSSKLKSHWHVRFQSATRHWSTRSRFLRSAWMTWKPKKALIKWSRCWHCDLERSRRWRFWS